MSTLVEERERRRKRGNFKELTDVLRGKPEDTNEELGEVRRALKVTFERLLKKYNPHLGEGEITVFTDDLFRKIDPQIKSAFYRCKTEELRRVEKILQEM